MREEYGLVDDGLVSRLERICEVSTRKEVLERHGKDESYHECVPPEVVVFPASTEEVSAVVRECAASRVAMIPYGSGTSLEGHVQALRGGVCVDVGMKMTNILEENVEDMVAICEAGVTRHTLNRSLRATGLEFCVDPGADASLGGMAATGASGTMAVSVGTMRENVLGMQAVLADGKIAEFGGRTKKSSAGYDLSRLFVGSEGTLGIITRVNVKLYPIPEFVAAAVVTFRGDDQVTSAAQSVVNLLGTGLESLRRCELLDATTIAAFNEYHHSADVPENATLFLEFGDATQEGVETHLALAEEICKDICESVTVESTFDETKAKDLWKARHATYYAALALKKPNGRAIVTDVCVPLSHFATMVEASVQDVRELNVVGPVFGHAGDGNIHTILCYNDHDDQHYLDRLHECNDRIVTRALKVGGTISGEHGIGSGKRKYLRRQFPPATIETMAAIKAALDPLAIMNPGKIL